MFFYHAIPVTVDSEPVVYSATAAPAVEIGEALTLDSGVVVATYNGEPFDVNGDDQIPVTVVDSDGYPVVMSKWDADRMAMPVTETEDEYLLRLCLSYAETKPWLGVDCW